LKFEYVACANRTIPNEIIELARSSRNNSNPFNFMNPSEVNAARSREIQNREMDIETTFSTQRKTAIFLAVIRAVKTKIESSTGEEDTNVGFDYDDVTTEVKYTPH